MAILILIGLAWFACSWLGVYAWCRGRSWMIDDDPHMFVVGVLFHAIAGPCSFPALAIFRADWRASR